MVFNSIPFALFLPATFLLYWLIGSRHRQGQNILLLAASYFFYAWWDVRFLSLLAGSTAFSYLLGKGIGSATSASSRRLYLYTGVAFSLGLLGFFKYYNFFAENLVGLFHSAGINLHIHSLRLILPLGISFYTFRILGYLLDVYHGKVTAGKDLIGYALFTGFFPQLVAGPIERATTLLPQFARARKFDYQQAADGLKLILWGLFKKVVIADSCASYVSDIYANYTLYPASMLVLGMFYFAFQVYADFSGYTDIAMGSAKLLGFELMQNFHYPFISKNITEFWRRWHISLSTWFNDYVFTPVYTALRNWGNAGMYFGIFLTFLLSGLWHGASWHFVFFGILHGLAIVLEAYTKKKRKKVAAKMRPWIYANLSMALTFSYVLITWVFFRADNMTIGFDYLGRLCSPSLFQVPGKLAYLPWIALLIIWEWIQRKKRHAMDLAKWPVALRWGIYLGLTLLTLYYFGKEQEFYYFKF